MRTVLPEIDVQAKVILNSFVIVFSSMLPRLKFHIKFRSNFNYFS